MTTPNIRRVVTGSADGGGAILSDAAATAITELPQVPGSALVDLWRSSQVPLAMQGDDGTSAPFELMPAGALFRIIELAPSDGEPLWHQTPTIDFIYIASGAATILYDDGAVDLGTGDTIVVRGIRHAWANRGTEVCRIIDTSIAAV